MEGTVVPSIKTSGGGLLTSVATATLSLPAVPVIAATACMLEELVQGDSVMAILVMGSHNKNQGHSVSGGQCRDIFGIKCPLSFLL